MKVAIVGSPNYSDLWQVITYVRRLPMDTLVISGAAKGVEAAVAIAARFRGLEVIEYLPDHDKYGTSASLHQSEEIVDHCDRLVAFWDGASTDTKACIDQAKATDKAVEVIIHRHNLAASP